jgi:hypothetical protein
MPFWSENFGQDTTMKDPKRKFRFTVEFQGIQSAQGGAMLWYAKTAAKPSFQIASAEHKYLNHTFYYPGSVTWQDVAITLVDPVNPDMAATLSDIVVLSGYSPPADSTDLASMTKAKAAGALGTVIVSVIDGNGDTLEKWTLWNSWITEVKYGDLEYGGDDLTELSVTLKYDWARLQTSTDGSVTTANAGANDFFSV